MLTTHRLQLRQWRESDLAPFARLNADPRVMEFFPALMTARQSDELALVEQGRIEARGWGLWAVEERVSSAFVGFVGLAEPRFSADFTPCVEIGWRLAPEFWGQGLATEAAAACLEFAQHELRESKVYAFTAAINLRSRAVMERLAMICQGQFLHPQLPEEHPLAWHWLYSKSFD